MATYTLISSVTLSSAAANIEFTSIPATYTDLLLKVSTRFTQSGSGTLVEVTFNNSGTSYTNKRLYTNGSAAYSDSSGTAYINVLAGSEGGWTASTFGNMEVYIPSYLVSQNKPFSSFAVSEQNSAVTNMDAIAALWRNTAAITSLNIISGNAGNLVSGSSFYLYGIKNS